MKHIKSVLVIWMYLHGVLRLIKGINLWVDTSNYSSRHLESLLSISVEDIIFLNLSEGVIIILFTLLTSKIALKKASLKTEFRKLNFFLFILGMIVLSIGGFNLIIRTGMIGFLMWLEYLELVTSLDLPGNTVIFILLSILYFIPKLVLIIYPFTVFMHNSR